MMRLLPLYVFFCVLCLSFSLLISDVSCAGSSPIVINPNIYDPNVPRAEDFEKCDGESEPCGNAYKCANGAECILRTCVEPLPNVKWPGGTSVPSCIAEKQIVTLTAAVFSRFDPKDVMKTTARTALVIKQMVVVNAARSSVNPDEIVPDYMARMYTAYTIDLGFFRATDPKDQTVDDVKYAFRDQLLASQDSVIDETAGSVFSIDNAPGALVNRTNFQFTSRPGTFTVCSDGTAVIGQDTCPPIDPAAQTNAASTTTTTTTRLLTIIAPIVGGVVFCALILAAVVIVRRRRANKVMRQTIQHTEPAVEVTMA